MRIRDWSSDVCSSDLLHPYAPSLRAKRSNPERFTHTLDCFASLAMTKSGCEGNNRQRSSALRPGEEGYSPSSEERCVWYECVSPCRSRWSPNHKQHTNTILMPTYSHRRNPHTT